MYKYFVYVNKFDKRVRIHVNDCYGCKNLNLTLEKQTISKNGIWYGFSNLNDAKSFAFSQNIVDTSVDRCIKP